MIKVKIQCSQLVHYDQEFELEEYEYELIKDLAGQEVSIIDRPRDSYELLEMIIDHKDVFDAEQCYNGVIVTKL